MSTIPYYLINVLPLVFTLAAIAWLSGAAVGKFLWSGYYHRAMLVRQQNQLLRDEIQRLNET